MWGLAKEVGQNGSIESQRQSLFLYRFSYEIWLFNTKYETCQCPSNLCKQIQHISDIPKMFPLLCTSLEMSNLQVVG